MQDKQNLAFAVSTLAFRGIPLEQVILLAAENGFSLEFSSGLPYRQDQVALCKSAPCKKYIHNYFPAPAIPFVLNLASLDESIFSRSMDHCMSNLELAKEIGCGFYSVHAGFCLDPDPTSLGKKLNYTGSHGRQNHWQRFNEALDRLCERAQTLGVRLLVENNVIASMNLLETGENPLLCCDAAEIERLFQQGPRHSLGLLLDTGHWKVSAGALGFDCEDVRMVLGKVEAVHHSDNDSINDQNQAIDHDYWFLKHMPAVRQALHVIEVHDLSVEQIFNQYQLLTSGAS